MRENSTFNRKSILLGFSGPSYPEDSLTELAQLAKTAGYDVQEIITSSLTTPNPRTFIGTGKLREVQQVIKKNNTAFLLVDEMLNPSQGKNLEEETGAAVLDRTGVILEIFSQRARSSEGKLQVEMARLQYMLPRLLNKGIEMSRLGGIPGTRGPGEPWLEKHRRRIRRRIHSLRKSLEKVRREREIRRTARKEANLPFCAIVGYTNAGKSSLFNRLTRADVYVDNLLFATLDPTIRRVFLPSLGREILLSDTVGFIRRLPHTLVQAFRATLEEVTEADFLLLVVDATRDTSVQISAVLEVLKQLRAHEKPRITVWNKIDLLSEKEIQNLPLIASEGTPEVCISALTGKGIPELYKHIHRLVQSEFPSPKYVPTGT